MKNNSLLKVNDLKAYFYLDEGVLKAVDGVSFKVRKVELVELFYDLFKGMDFKRRMRC